ncbi:gliding motility-associated C-terminal domain-containing protein [Paraflavitalea soli]|uniref:Gliding motility-associated C-terminal domain-containing protein n=1 Tax=Paraflavitalea soli TaxID=2315862 RepID=A0A3B7MGK6_9BACT|nr:CshA/CshB family fibrillar adhesin-related protein [Paraflavitalea soli]AXY73504.1 gliding motility-associated C-terminal domain-containing protein [Paraflavitalea soli]
MMRFFVLAMVLSYSTFSSLAQYADQGTGNLRNEIWWFNWAGFTISDGATRTFTTTDGLSITVRFSQVSPAVPVPWVMNTWRGAIFHLLYNFSDPSIQPALYSSLIAADCRFTMRVTASRAGAPVAFTFVTADAEASTPFEVTKLTTNGSNWQTIDFFRNSTQTTNPVTGCNTQAVSLAETYGGASLLGQNPMLATEANTGDLTLGVAFERNGTNGSMGITFGLMAPVDRGDLPASYGSAHHRISYSVNNSCNYLAPLPSVSRFDGLYIGSTPPDADGSETLDDNASGVDEESSSMFPIYDGSGTYQVQVPVHNTTGQNAYLTGWFDYDRNGVFGTGEAVTLTVLPNAIAATLTWTGLPAYLSPGTAAGYGFRLRLGSDAGLASQATGFARDGEVEDHFIASAAWCTMDVNTIGDTTVCAGEPVSLQATGAIQYQWNTTVYLSDPQIANPIATPANAIRYIVTGSNPQGCEAKDTVDIMTKAKPVITMSAAAVICPGATTQLSAFAPGAASYNWRPQQGLSDAAISNPVAGPAVNTKYLVEVKGTNGCHSKDSVTINVRSISSFAASANKGTICAGDTIILQASGGDEYTWSSGTSNLATNVNSLLVHPATSTNYGVTIKENTCQGTAILNIPVTVNPLPRITVTSSNDVGCANSQAILHVRGASTYVWDAIPGITQLTAADPVVTPLVPTTYYVQATDQHGCIRKDSVFVAVNFQPDKQQYNMASAFTPNNDGNNDCFGLKYWGRVTSLQFEVFNRWGERVFSATNASSCWNGYYKGTLQPNGGYVYQVKAVTTCGTVYRKGVVMLLR